MRHIRKPILRIDELRLTALVGLAALAGLLSLTIERSNRSMIEWPDVQSGVILFVALASMIVVWSLSGFPGDQLLLPVVAALLVIGHITLARLDQGVEAVGRAPGSLADRQLAYTIGGLALMTAVGRFFRWWHLLRRFRYTVLLVCIALLLTTFVFGTPINGARLWITVGPIQVQPSEVIKIGLVLFLASYLDEHRDLIGAPWRLGPVALPPVPYLLPMMVMWATSLLVLVIENDLGSALLLYGVFLIMLYLGTNRTLYVVAGLATFAAACWAALALFGRVRVRVDNWLDPWRDPLDAGYQQIQSDYAVASGGILGSGPGAGEPWRIPVVETDYIFSAIGEEFGLLGTLCVVLLFWVLTMRGISIALAADDGYLRLVAAGLSVTIAIQTVVILGGVLRLIPLTGITLPFVSYGGSSLIVNFVAIGLLANISSQQRR